MYCQGSSTNTRVTHMNTHAERLEEALSAQINIELAERDMTQKDLAEAVGVGRPAMNHYMRGHRSMPMPTFIRVAEVLGLSPQTLWARAEARIPQEAQSA